MGKAAAGEGGPKKVLLDDGDDIRRQMLEPAAAAVAEMPADRPYPSRPRFEDLDDPRRTAIAATLARLDAEAVARCGEGNVEPALGRTGEAVALRADRFDRHLHEISPFSDLTCVTGHVS